MYRAGFTFAALMLAVGCADVTDPDGDNELEAFTTVELTFNDGAGDTVATWADPANDGTITVDPISLSVGKEYALTVKFFNELEDPAEDMTVEVNDEADEHQVLFYGDAITGPASTSASAIATHAYDDMDSNDLPIGLTNTLTADTAGTGPLKVMLRHLPEEDGTAVKVDGLAGEFADGGSSAIGGDVDIDVEFDLTVE